jgi:hypothetical protein
MMRRITQMSKSGTKSKYCASTYAVIREMVVPTKKVTTFDMISFLCYVTWPGVVDWLRGCRVTVKLLWCMDLLRNTWRETEVSWDLVP